MHKHKIGRTKAKKMPYTFTNNSGYVKRNLLEKYSNFLQHITHKNSNNAVAPTDCAIMICWLYVIWISNCEFVNMWTARAKKNIEKTLDAEAKKWNESINFTKDVEHMFY